MNEGTMYIVMTLVAITILSVILIHDMLYEVSDAKLGRAFRILLTWVIFFTAQDAVWGVCATLPSKNRTLLFISSTFFHVCTITTAIIWLYYVLTYAGDKIEKSKRYFIAGICLWLVQVALIIVNIFKPIIFYIDENCVYCPSKYRFICFVCQYIIYFIIALISAYSYFKTEGELKHRYAAIFSYVVSPIAFGVFQYLYYYAPFYSIGYLVGCVIIHLFVVSDERERIIIRKSQTDEVTGLQNRKAYEEYLEVYGNDALPADFVYVSLDLNGLKQMNDSKGHSMGDVLLRGAADCIRECFEDYGSVYRTGGDEFIALICTAEENLSGIFAKFEDTTAQWKNEHIDGVSVSYGYVARKENLGSTIKELAIIADMRMYAAKAEYYKKNGKDRRRRS